MCLFITQFGIIFKQMMEMHIKAVHVVGACATIKLERWVHGSEIF